MDNLNKDIDNISGYLLLNSLLFNINKCKAMLMNNKLFDDVNSFLN